MHRWGLGAKHERRC